MKNKEQFQNFTSAAVQSDSYTINTRRNGSVVVIEISGELVRGPAVINMRQIMADLVTAGENYVVTNLGDVSKIDGAGLRAILDAFTTCEQQGGKLAIVRPRGHYLGALLRETMFPTFAPICACESSAVDAMFQQNMAA